LNKLTFFTIRFFVSEFYGQQFIGLFVSIFTTSGLITNLLKKGSIDLFLSKPVSRIHLIMGKYVGGILIVLLNVSYLIVGIWMLTALKFGYWDASILYSILTITFVFAVLYALMAFVGILTKSPVLPMILSYAIYIVLSPLIYQRVTFSFAPDYVKDLLETLHYIIPNTSEILEETTKLVLQSGGFDFEPFIISFVFMIVFLGGALYAFEKKDF